jgi:exopolysaccharide biosynthesis polyprenyl glycosylphosphotransferase
MLRTGKYIRFFYLVIDIIFIVISFAIPYFLNPFLIPNEPIKKNIYLGVFLFWGICLVLIFNNFQLYTTPRYLSLIKENIMVCKAVVYASILVTLYFFLLKIDNFPHIVFIESVFYLFLFTSTWRFTKRICARELIKHGFSNYNVLIIGADKEVELILREIEAYPFLGLRIKGILDDKKRGDFCGFKILGEVKELERIVKKYFIDEIYITSSIGKDSMQGLLLRCEKLGKAVRVVINDFSSSSRRVGLNYLGSIPLLTFSQGVEVKANSTVKRLFDIWVSCFLLILSLPLFIVISLLIKVEDGGPIFYVSKRSGRKGKSFNFYKFRSMVTNADFIKRHLLRKSDTDGPIFKMKRDPRITRIGRFLRRYSLDELPQLINVLKGDMSLVGPRPFPVEENDKIEYQHIPRLNIRPGITGLAQIKGRSDLKFNQWMRWDSWYVKNWSLGLDIKIILWTIPTVLNGKGAY